MFACPTFHSCLHVLPYLTPPSGISVDLYSVTEHILNEASGRSQSTLQYDTFWVGQHAVFVFLASMTLYLVYCFPPRYCDILHRAALHLGTWSRVDDRRAHISFNP